MLACSHLPCGGARYPLSLEHQQYDPEKPKETNMDALPREQLSQMVTGYWVSQMVTWPPS